MNAEYRQMRRELAADYDRPAPLPRSVLGTRCPWCRAAEGTPCIERASERPLRHTQAHPARWRAARVEMPTPTVPAGALSREQGTAALPVRDGLPNSSAGAVAS